MSDSRKHRRQSDFDISTSAQAPAARGIGNVAIWLAIFALAMLVFYVEPDMGWLLVLPFLGLAVLAVLSVVAWQVIVKRGLFTWGTLAHRPAMLMARGDAAGAEQAYEKALARARRFAPDDHRRGLMLCELALFAKHQGRYPETLDLYEESVNILSQHAAKSPLDYFVALNNYAICFIYLKDYESAQRHLEKGLDLTFAVRKREAGTFANLPLQSVQMIQFVMHMNLAALFLAMDELAEAEVQLHQADSLFPLLSKRFLAAWHDHYIGVCALWEFESGKFAAAESELAQARNPDHYVCQRVRAMLHMVRLEYAEAERLLRASQADELTRGSLRRPELLRVTLEFAESLFGQEKHDEAFAALQEARAIVKDFALPSDEPWRKALQLWLKRAKELGRAEAGDLEAAVAKMPAKTDVQITILASVRRLTQ